MSLEEDYASYRERCLLFDKNRNNEFYIGHFAFIINFNDLNCIISAIISFRSLTFIPDDFVSQYPPVLYHSPCKTLGYHKKTFWWYIFNLIFYKR